MELLTLTSPSLIPSSASLPSLSLFIHRCLLGVFLFFIIDSIMIFNTSSDIHFDTSCLFVGSSSTSYCDQWRHHLLVIRRIAGITVSFVADLKKLAPRISPSEPTGGTRQRNLCLQRRCGPLTSSDDKHIEPTRGRGDSQPSASSTDVPASDPCLHQAEVRGQRSGSGFSLLPVD